MGNSAFGLGELFGEEVGTRRACSILSAIMAVILLIKNIAEPYVPLIIIAILLLLGASLILFAPNNGCNRAGAIGTLASALLGVAILYFYFHFVSLFEYVLIGLIFIADGVITLVTLRR